jgi:hypothetical protein
MFHAAAQASPPESDEVHSDDIRPEDSASKVGEQDVHVESESAVGSLVSAPVGNVGHCFLSTCMFKSYPHGSLKAAKDVEEGEGILATDGRQTRVVQKRTIPCQRQHIVRLETESATLEVTDSHRVPARRRNGELQKMPAGRLCKGDVVLCSGDREEQLVAVEYLAKEVTTIQMTFHPDLPVEAFGPVILSHGYKRYKISHGYRKQRAFNIAQVPSTDDDF